MKEIKKVRSIIVTVKFGQQQSSLIRKLVILKGELERNRTTLKEAELYEKFVYQLVLAEGTTKHMKGPMNAHKDDSECELKKL